MARQCAGEIVCTVCAKPGHTYARCPSSYSGQLKLGSRFSDLREAGEKLPAAAQKEGSGNGQRDGAAAPADTNNGQEEGEMSGSNSEGKAEFTAGSGAATDTQCVAAADAALPEASSEASTEINPLSQDLFCNQSSAGLSEEWIEMSRRGRGRRAVASLSDSDESSRSGGLVIDESPHKPSKKKTSRKGGSGHVSHV